MPRTLFHDRQHAAAMLAERVAEARLPQPRVVLALPRGGAPIGAAVAQRLGAVLDLLLVRKIGAPWQSELAVGALVEGAEPLLVVDEDLARRSGADSGYIEQCKAQAWQEIVRRRSLYLAGREPVPVQGATVVVCDDGMATGVTMRAALMALKQRGAAGLVVAVPVASHEAIAALRHEADRVICLAEPIPFHAVGEHYADFHQLSDQEVIDALQSTTREKSAMDDQRA
ncbi:phosphoribosyltransferase [Sphaerotilus microaerophilus]|uniref:Phosphoribosyltransferase n=1 Tax=Sphaerotilus microaerophilus TaxID=2914710 RepID=A0ABN6PNH7_9BURK|nr:phosphoribosyltransferase family protein [Sphaerotilus sp. FB-5]BDI05127.1 phosphoribosyltransferase [Sphaerotilus sp. FB-5]